MKKVNPLSLQKLVAIAALVVIYLFFFAVPGVSFRQHAGQHI